MAIRIPLIQVNGRLQELPVGDKIPTEVVAPFEYTQTDPATTWEITHNLGKHPVVVVIGPDNKPRYGGVSYDSDNKVTLSFSRPITGKAFLT